MSTRKKEKTDIVVVSKGQLVIPQRLRQRQRIGAKSKLLVYPYEDSLTMKELEAEGVEKELEAMYRRIDPRRAKYAELSEEEINNVVQRYGHMER